jgi:CBS domain-containing protein
VQERLSVPSYGFLDRLARDVMTRDVVTVSPRTRLRDVELLFEGCGFNGVPVVDSRGQLLGMLTKFDTLRAFKFTTSSIVPRYAEIQQLPAERVMTRNPRSVDPEMPLTHVLEILIRTRYKSLPVVEDGKLAGIVSRKDVLAALRRSAA